MKRFLGPWVVSIIMLAAPLLHAAQSTITEAEGNACRATSDPQTNGAGRPGGRKAQRRRGGGYLYTEREPRRSFTVEKDIIAAYTNAAVKILEVCDKAWHRDPTAGECYRVRIRAEVVPDVKAPAESPAVHRCPKPPAAPFQVRIWTDKPTYREGEKIRIRLQGNRPFYARILYRDASGGLLQLLPNPHRKDDYFQGGVTYELPAEGDRFDLAVSPPFGAEDILVYASTSPLGKIDLAAAGAVYQVETRPADVATRTRGVRIEARPGAGQPAATSFVESKVTIKTAK